MGHVIFRGQGPLVLANVCRSINNIEKDNNYLSNQGLGMKDWGLGERDWGLEIWENGGSATK